MTWLERRGHKNSWKSLDIRCLHFKLSPSTAIKYRNLSGKNVIMNSADGESPTKGMANICERRRGSKLSDNKKWISFFFRWPSHFLRMSSDKSFFLQQNFYFLFPMCERQSGPRDETIRERSISKVISDKKVWVDSLDSFYWCLFYSFAASSPSLSVGALSSNQIIGLFYY